MAKPPEVKIDADFIKRALRWNYCHNQKVGKWVVLFELCTKTGGANIGLGERYLDAFAFNCWPSENYKKIAFEIKVARSDFKTELANPIKRLQSIIYSNQHYFIVPKGLVKVGEVPRDSGLIEVTKAGEMLTRRRAPATEAVPFPNCMLMSALRNAQKYGESDGWHDAYNQGKNDGLREFLFTRTDETLKKMSGKLGRYEQQIEKLDRMLREKDFLIMELSKNKPKDIFDLGVPNG